MLSAARTIGVWLCAGTGNKDGAAISQLRPSQPALGRDSDNSACLSPDGADSENLRCGCYSRTPLGDAVFEHGNHPGVPSCTCDRTRVTSAAHQFPNFIRNF